MGNRDTYAQAEGREYLKLITEVSPEKIDQYEGYAIEAWLVGMGYEWNGSSWLWEGYDEEDEGYDW